MTVFQLPQIHHPACLGMLAFLGVVLFLPAGPELAAAESIVQYRVNGLFQPDRQEAFNTAAQALEGCHLTGVEYDTALASFAYDPDNQLFKNAKPEQVLQRINDQIRRLTNGCFTLSLPGKLPPEKLVEIRFEIEGLDCLGCSFGAYLSVAGIDGVERATASFHEGRLTAWIDPAKTNREALAAALTKKEIKIIQP